MKGISVVKQQHIPDNSQKDKKKVDKNVWKKIYSVFRNKNKSN